jgi:hypothetical protein
VSEQLKHTLQTVNPIYAFAGRRNRDLRAEKVIHREDMLNETANLKKNVAGDRTCIPFEFDS